MKKSVEAKLKAIEDTVQVVDKKINMAKTIVQEESKEKRGETILFYTGLKKAKPKMN